MVLLEIIVLGVALSADAFAVTISNTFVYAGESRSRLMLMPLMFGLFQGLMPVAGYLLGGLAAEVIETYAGVITLAILGLVGGNMIREGRLRAARRGRAGRTRGARRGSRGTPPHPRHRACPGHRHGHRRVRRGREPARAGRERGRCPLPSSRSRRFCAASWPLRWAASSARCWETAPRSPAALSWCS